MKCDICGKELVDGKIIRAFNHVLCAKHYQQFLKFGHNLDTIQRTIYDLNELEYCDDGIWIITFKKTGELSGRFLIDNDEYAPEIIKHKWRFWKGRYFTGNYHPIDISRFVMKLAGNDTDSLVVDHINNNPADNRKENLRVCSQGQNAINKSKQQNNTSNFVGISYNDERQKYEIEIRYQHKRVHFTRQKKLEDAVYIRYIAELLLFKEFRCTKYDEQILPYINSCTRKKELKQYVSNKLSQTYDLN